jgi:hypothetical protein
VRIKHSSPVVPRLGVALAVVLALVLTLIMGAQVSAAVPASALADQPAPVRVTENSYPDGYAQVSGDRIVWLGASDAANPDNQQVFTWTPSGGVVQLSVNSQMNQWPMVSGDRVVWFGTGGSVGGEDGEIFTWTPTGGLVQITTNDVDDQTARVSGDRVVWAGHDGSWIYQIYTWTPAGVTTKVSDDATGAFGPVVSGDRIAWSGDGGHVVYTWTQASGPVIVSELEDPGSKQGLRVSGNRVAWMSAQNVYTWTPAAGLVELTDHDAGPPELSGDRLVWNYWDGTTYQLFTWTPAGGAVQITTGSEGVTDYRVSGDRVVWQPYNSDIPSVLSWTPGDGITEIAASSWGAAVSGNRVVWCSGADADVEIYTAVYAPTVATRFDQANTNIEKTGAWSDYPNTSAYLGSYGRSSTSGASATVWFTGTKIAWIGMKGGTPGIVDVYLDDVKKATLDLYSSPAKYQVTLWTSDALSNGVHHMDLVRNKDSLSTEFIVLDAVDIWGTIIAAPPTITSLSPSSGPPAGGTPVTINGTGFADVSSVTFDGESATSVIVNSSTKITAAAPAHTAGAVRVAVTAAGGTTPDTTADDFTYADAPPTTRVDLATTTAAGLTVSGAWAAFTSASAHGGCYLRSSTSGAYLVIAFKGTRLDWITMKGITGAKADIYVDGSTTKAATVDLYQSPAVYQQNLFSTGTLPEGYHTVKIVRSTASASGRYLTIDAVEVAGTLVAPLRVDETDSHPSWSPAFASWTTGTTTSASGGTYKYINTAGAYMDFSFTGVGFKIIAKTAPSYGNLTVTIDGVSRTVSLYSSATTYKKVVLTAFMTPGVHTIKIARAGTKSGSSSGYTIDLDAVDLIGEW